MVAPLIRAHFERLDFKVELVQRGEMGVLLMSIYNILELSSYLGDCSFSAAFKLKDEMKHYSSSL